MHPTAASLLRPAALGTALAAVGVAAVHLLATALGDPLTVTTAGAPMAVPLVAAVLFTVLGGAVGYGLALLARRVARPRAVFLGVTLVALALFAIPPFGATGSVGTALWLNAMHLVAAAGVLPPLARALPAARVPAGGAPVNRR
jgi:hypothetical protein